MTRITRTVLCGLGLCAVATLAISPVSASGAVDTGNIHELVAFADLATCTVDEHAHVATCTETTTLAQLDREVGNVTAGAHATETNVSIDQSTFTIDFDGNLLQDLGGWTARGTGSVSFGPSLSSATLSAAIVGSDGRTREIDASWTATDRQPATSATDHNCSAHQCLVVVGERQRFASVIETIDGARVSSDAGVVAEIAAEHGVVITP